MTNLFDWVSFCHPEQTRSRFWNGPFPPRWIVGFCCLLETHVFGIGGGGWPDSTIQSRKCSPGTFYKRELKSYCNSFLILIKQMVHISLVCQSLRMMSRAQSNFQFWPCTVTGAGKPKRRPSFAKRVCLFFEFQKPLVLAIDDCRMLFKPTSACPVDKMCPFRSKALLLLKKEQLSVMARVFLSSSPKNFLSPSRYPS